MLIQYMIQRYCHAIILANGHHPNMVQPPDLFCTDITIIFSHNSLKSQRGEIIITSGPLKQHLRVPINISFKSYPTTEGLLYAITSIPKCKLF
jgi:hypothetical protein